MSFISRAHPRQGLAATLASVAPLLGATHPAHGQCTTAPCFQGLGDLPGGATHGYASGLSADGETVVGRSQSPSGSEAFRWTAATGMIGLGDLSGGVFYSEANGVSGDGSIVTGYSASANGEREAFRWTLQNGMTGIGDLAGGLFRSEGGAISADGLTIVGNGNSGYNQAYRWTQAEGMVGIGDLPGGIQLSEARGVSASGSVIVGHSCSTNAPVWPPNLEAFCWTQVDGIVPLGDLPGGPFISNAVGVSADGSIIVGLGNSASGQEAMRWIQSTGMVGLNDLPGGAFQSAVLGISADGALMVGYGASALGLEAVMWSESLEIMRLVDVLPSHGVMIPAGWILTQATAITVNGSIVTLVGSGANPQGDTEAWIARYSTPCVLQADLDADCDIDLADYVNVAECIFGPEVSPSPTPPPTGQECLYAFDFEPDTDVDLGDFAEFQIGFSG